MKCVILLAEGFEEVEALCPADMLRRAGVETLLAGVDAAAVKGARGITVKADLLLKDLAFTPDCIVLPGGNPGFKNLQKSAAVKELTLKTYEKGGLVAAICAAPTVVSSYGLLKGKKACVYPGMEDMLDCADVSFEKVVRDGRIITSRGAGTAMDFSLALVSALVSDAASKTLASQVVYE